jgi:hypothetical protein
MKSTIWLSYDLGVRGDYDPLYTWLDSHGAKECGDSLAVLVYKHNGQLVDQLRAELKATIAVDKRTRIYVIHRDREGNKNKGDFLFGSRRVPPWNGFAGTGEDSDTEV